MAEVQEKDLMSAGALQEWWANPAVVGLMGFATTTMATGLHNVGYWGAGTTLAMALFFGGTAQLIAGIVDLRKGSLFGGSAFTSYGAFWLALFTLLFILPTFGGVEITATDELGFFLMWTLFTAFFAIAVLRVGKYLTALFWLLLIAFILLDGVTLGVVPAPVAGWEIFVTGLVAWYIAGAELVNGVFGEDVLPLA